MTIDQIITALATITLVQMMFTIGLSANVRQVLSVARDWRLVTKAALANYVLFPAAAVLLLLWFRPNPLVAVGFLIAAVCPGAPFGPPFTALAKGNTAFAVGLMVLLAASSALLAPALLLLLLPIVSAGQDLRLNPGPLLGALFGGQLVPLAIGLAVRALRPTAAGRLRRPCGVLSTLLNVLTFGLILVVQFPALVRIRPTGYLGMLALVAAGLLFGWLLGGPGRGNRTALAMVTSVRNLGVAIVIASASFAGTPAVTATTAFGLFQTVVIATVALAWGHAPCSSAKIS